MKKRNRIILIVSILLGALVLLVFGIRRWITIKLPEQIKISRVYITLEPDSIFLKIRVVVPNNAIADRLLDSMRYIVSFDSVEFSSGIKEFGSETADTIIDLPLGMDKDRLFSTIDKLQVKDSTYLIIKLEPYLRLPGKGNNLVPFTITKRIKVPIPPEVTIRDIDLEKLRLHEISLSAVLQVINLNQFEFMLLDGSFKLDFPKLFDGAISITEPVQLKKTDTTFIETAVQVGDLKIARTAWNFAFKKDEIEYSLYGKLHVSMVDEPQDTVEIILRSDKNSLQ